MKRSIIIYLILCIIAPATIEAKKKPFGNGLYWEISDLGILTISGSGEIPNYYSGKKTPWHNGKSVHTIIIEEGITYIGGYALSNNAYTKLPNVKNVILPSSLIEIGRNAFLGLMNLERIDFKEGLQYIDDWAFYECYKLHDLIFPTSLKEIGDNAFWNCSLSSVSLPTGLLNVGSDAFQNNPLSTISIPYTVKSIGKNCFQNNGGNASCKILSLPGIVNLSNCESFGISKQSVQQYLNGVRDIYGKLVIPAVEGRTITRCIDQKDLSFYYRISEKGIEGIADRNGNWTIPFERGLTDFDSLRLNTAAYYIAKNSKTSRFCIISAKGEYLLDKEYDLIERAGKGYLRIKDGSYYGIVTTRGKEIIPTTRNYSYINNFDGNYFAFTKKGYSGKCDKRGQELSITKLPPTADEIKEIGGYASAVEHKDNNTKYYKVSKGGRYGLTDSEGREIIPCKMESLESAGTGYLRYKINGFWGVMDYSGINIIDSDRGYTSIGNFVTLTKRFPYTMAGFKGECDINGRQISKIKVETPEQMSSPSTSSSLELTTPENNGIYPYEYSESNSYYECKMKNNQISSIVSSESFRININQDKNDNNYFFELYLNSLTAGSAVVKWSNVSPKTTRDSNLCTISMTLSNGETLRIERCLMIDHRRKDFQDADRIGAIAIMFYPLYTYPSNNNQSANERTQFVIDQLSKYDIKSISYLESTFSFESAKTAATIDAMFKSIRNHR